MTPLEQTQAFGRDLDNLIERYGDEFDLNYSQVIGVLTIKIHMLCANLREDDDD